MVIPCITGETFTRLWRSEMKMQIEPTGEWEIFAITYTKSTTATSCISALVHASTNTWLLAIYASCQAMAKTWLPTVIVGGDADCIKSKDSRHGTLTPSNNGAAARWLHQLRVPPTKAAHCTPVSQCHPQHRPDSAKNQDQMHCLFVITYMHITVY